MSKALKILLNAIPIALMIGLIPVVRNDYLLSLIYVIIISIALAIKYEPKDMLVLVFGFFVMIAAEYFFVSTGVEIFVRRSLLGFMPFWLPILWAYAFIRIKRGVLIVKKGIC